MLPLGQSTMNDTTTQNRSTSNSGSGYVEVKLTIDTRVEIETDKVISDSNLTDKENEFLRKLKITWG